VSGESRASISLSAGEARRLALAAQGFAAGRGEARSPWPKVAAAIDRMQLLQLDSVSALVRTHYLPVYSRIGNYDRARLDRHAFAPGRHREFFEYWAHEASLLPLRLHPLMRWRMARGEKFEGKFRGFAKFAREHRDYIRAVEREVRERGPIAASDLDDPGKRNGPWWGWHKGKTTLEYLFDAGRVTTAFRRGFERVYDLPERVIPAEVLALPAPSERDAIRDLLRLSSVALGVATLADLRDYFRLPVAETRRALAELVEEGGVEPASVEGWRQPAFLARGAKAPARNTVSALVSPFDPLVWFRDRTARLFGFHYRIEIYTPAAKRRYGYYVLPFLHRGRLAARLDLKADRPAGTLHAHGIFAEEKAERTGLAEAVAAELRHLAMWLGLDEIRVGTRGDLAAPVARLV